MNPQHNGDPHFRVQLTGRATDQLAEIIRKANLCGKVEEVRTAYRLIRRRLRTAPRDFGEEAGPLLAARMDLFSAAVAPLVVHYGVHQELPEVFIREFRDML